jgi:hypothetical protein
MNNKFELSAHCDINAVRFFITRSTDLLTDWEKGSFSSDFHLSAWFEFKVILESFMCLIADIYKARLTMGLNMAA